MGLSVRPHQPGPIHRKHHMVAADGHIVQDLIVSPLQKGGINGAYGDTPPGGQTGGHGHCVLLRDAHIEKPVGMLLGKRLQARAGGHGRRDGADPVILLRQPTKLLSEYRRKVGFSSGDRLSRGGIEGGHTVKISGRLLRGLIAQALDGFQMDHHRTIQLFGLMQQGAHRADIISVGGAQIFKSHQLKDGLLQDGGAQRPLPCGDRPDQPGAAWHPAQQRLGALLHPEIPGLDADGRQPLGQCAHIGADGHIVVVKHHD